MIATTVSPNLKSFINRPNPVANGFAIAYPIFGYLVGFGLFFQANIWLNLVGLVLLTHSLLIAAYLTHELMHGNIFVSQRWNAVWGTIMLWLTGSCYSTFDQLKAIHLSHHIDRVDFSNFDLAATMQALPKPLRWLILGLEWCYIPVITIWQVGRGVINLWQQPAQRLHLIMTFVIRSTAFVLLGYFFPKVLLLYIVAYISLLNLLRWMDAFHHTYEVFPAGTHVVRSHEHEQNNTFTNLLSRRYPWLNLLTLNFGYHNAHHEVMKCPWHSLPELDRLLYNNQGVHYIPVGQMLRNYHRFRIKRIFTGQGQAVDANRQPTPNLFYGAIGVSFLTAL